MKKMIVDFSTKSKINNEALDEIIYIISSSFINNNLKPNLPSDVDPKL